jgi:hypothetical protein
MALGLSSIHEASSDAGNFDSHSGNRLALAATHPGEHLPEESEAVDRHAGVRLKQGRK